MNQSKAVVILSSGVNKSRSWPLFAGLLLCQVNKDINTSLLLYEPYANVSSQICPFLALLPQFHSNHRVHLSMPRYCQSATFGRLTFCVYHLLFFTDFAFKAGHRSTLAFLRFCVIAATGIRKHTQVELLWITRRIRRISAFPINSERLDASVFTSTLPATKRNSRTTAFLYTAGRLPTINMGRPLS